MNQNRKIYSVSELNNHARILLEEHFGQVIVRGEVSEFTEAMSGHWYFSLKDESAQLRCVMFRTQNLRCPKPAVGDVVRLEGRLSLYAERGSYQLIAASLDDDGSGHLRRAFEQLKNQLETEGLFAPERKQPLPSLPHHLAVITSAGSAALQDVLKVLSKRAPFIPVTVVPVPVQGSEATPAIVAALDTINTVAATLSPPVDLVLLTRGGGSAEDLWCFNEEATVRAVAASALPVISAVGHEIDFTLTDFAADLRAPTPSAAAETLSPDSEQWQLQLERQGQQLAQLQQARLAVQRREIDQVQRRLRHPDAQLEHYLQSCDELFRRIENSQRLVQHNLGELTVQLQRRLRNPGKQVADYWRQTDNWRRGINVNIKRVFKQTLSRLEHANSRLQAHNPGRQLATQRQRLAGFSKELKLLQRQQFERLQPQLERSQERVIDSTIQMLNRYRHRLKMVLNQLDAHNPLAVLDRGYSLMSDDEGQVVRSVKQVKPGSRLRARLAEGELDCIVEELHPPAVEKTAS